MKLSSVLLCVPLLFTVAVTPKNATKEYDGRAYDTSLKMDFTDSTDEEIIAYYDANTLSKLKGEELTNKLYDVIHNNNYFISYSDVNKWYKITDRNWSLSREISADNYLFNEDTKDNYYLTLTYYEDSANQDKAKAINSYVNNFSKDSQVTGVDWENSKRHDVNNQEDKEHLWAKSHGFDVKSGDPAKGAGTDLHHLVAADHSTNSYSHKDYEYGDVVDKSTAKQGTCYYADGSTAISGWTGNDANGNLVFEPTNEWKGDIARAILYMGVRYSAYQDYNTQEEPYLVVTNNNAAVDNFISKDDLTIGIDDDSDNHYHGIHKNLSTFLKWNEIDPVSTYEVHRNNLIYKNVQRNRNPFIDYPSWAKRVYASSDVNDNGSITPSHGEGSNDAFSSEDSSNVDINQSSNNQNTNDSDLLYNILSNKVYVIIIIVIVIVIILIIITLILLSNKKVKRKHG